MRFRPERPLRNEPNARGMTMIRNKLFQLGLGSVAGLAAAVALVAPAEAGAALDAIRAKGQLVCGVGQAVPGFAAPGANGELAGIDIDYCKSMAAAIFGDPSKVTYRQTSYSER